MKALALAVVLLLALPVPLFSASSSQSEDVVLVSGFEPFDRWDSNPSGELAHALNDTMLGGVHVVGVVLPVSFEDAYPRLRMAFDRYSPSAVIALGLDGSARVIEVERMAVNLQHPAMFGFSFVNGSGPFVRHTRLPTGDIVAALHDDGVDARQSWFAGLYVCNHVFYRLLGDAVRRDISAGFIHVPPLPSQDPSGMPFDVMLRGIRTAVNVTVPS